MHEFNPRISDGQDYLDYLSGQKPKWFKRMNEKHNSWLEQKKQEIDKKLSEVKPFEWASPVLERAYKEATCK